MQREERHSHIERLHSMGYTIVAMADELSVSRPTIYADMDELGLATFSPISDDYLVEVVRECITNAHSSVGVGWVEGHLLAEYCLRVQRRRVTAALRVLSNLRRPQPRVFRLNYYNGVGINFNWHGDQVRRRGPIL